MGEVVSRWKGSNLTQVAGFNEAVVLDALRRSDGLSRVDVAQETALSPQTVSNIVRRLIEGGLVLEGERVARPSGKRSTLLRLKPGGRYAFGVHFDRLQTTFVALDFLGRVVADRVVPVDLGVSPEESIDSIRSTLHELRDRARIELSRSAGVGVALPGAIDPTTRIVRAPRHLPEWQGSPIVPLLEDALGVPVIADTDVIAAATGEHWAGVTRDYSDSVCLYLSSGVGAGIMFQNTVLRGFSGNPGEIRHLIVDPEGVLCECGLRGCAEATLGAEGVVEQARMVGVDVGPANTSVSDCLGMIAQAMSCDEAPALELRGRLARQLAKAVMVLADVTDTAAVVLSGPTWARLGACLMPHVAGLVGEGMGAAGPNGRRLLGTGLGEHGTAIGAASLVLSRSSAPDPLLELAAS